MSTRLLRVASPSRVEKRQIYGAHVIVARSLVICLAQGGRCRHCIIVTRSAGHSLRAQTADAAHRSHTSVDAGHVRQKKRFLRKLCRAWKMCPSRARSLMQWINTFAAPPNEAIYVCYGSLIWRQSGATYDLVKHPGYNQTRQLSAAKTCRGLDSHYSQTRVLALGTRKHSKQCCSPRSGIRTTQSQEVCNQTKKADL